MDKYFLPLVTLFLTLSAHAQEKFYEEPIGWHGKGIELHAISDREKLNSCLFLCNGDSVRGFALDSKQAVTQHFYFNLLPGEQFVGGFIKGGKAYAFLQTTHGTSNLHVWVCDLVRGTRSDYVVLFDMLNERAVEEINGGDRFLYFTVNRRKSQFIVYDFGEDQRIDTLRYTFEAGVWKALTKYDGNFGREVSVIKIDPDGRMDPDLGRIPNKLYWTRDTLFLLMNNWQKGVTAVFRFDIPGKKVGLRKIVHNDILAVQPPVVGYADNSYVLDDRLYFVSADDQKLDLQILDFHSGSLLRDYTVRSFGDSLFKNIPVIVEGSLARKDPQDQPKLWQLRQKMYEGSAVLVANREDSGRVSLTIGAWQEIEKGYPGAPVYMASTGTFVSSGLWFRSTKIRSSRFTMTMDSIEYLPGAKSATINDRILRYTGKISIPPAGESLFHSGGKYVYAYYDRDQHTLVLTNF